MTENFTVGLFLISHNIFINMPHIYIYIYRERERERERERVCVCARALAHDCVWVYITCLIKMAPICPLYLFMDPPHTNTHTFIHFLIHPLYLDRHGDGQMKLFFVGGPNQRKDYHVECGEEVIWERPNKRYCWFIRGDKRNDHT